MKNYILLTLFSFAISANCWGSLYQCENYNSEPVKQASSEGKFQVSVETKSGVWNDNISFTKDLKKKKPFLIYYSVDSSEPFMSHAVAFEIANLIQRCKRTKHVSFVAVLNSLYQKSNQFLFCKDQIVKFVNIASDSKFDKELKEKKRAIIEDDNSRYNSNLKYLVRYEKQTNIAFGDYPLAHPDFLYSFLNKIVTDKALFPSSKYIPFLNLKSHGSQQTVLSGMYSCQLESKVRTQQDTINLMFSDDERSQLRGFDTVEKILKDMPRYEFLLSRLNLGSVNPSNDGSHSDGNLGAYNLGIYNLGQNFEIDSVSGLGTNLLGLGTSQGLGSQRSFGLNHTTLNTVLDDLFSKETKRSLGFLMLESCDTNRELTFEHRYAENIIGYYSASYSLWYRNIDWWEILEEANGMPEKVISILKERVVKIPNLHIQKYNDSY